MTNEARLEIIKSLFAECEQVFTIKGDAYADKNGDALSNFKRNAIALGLSPYQIWAIYFNKHVDSILNAIKDNPNRPIDKSEGLRSRITDIINYAGLLECLLEENAKPETGTIFEKESLD